MMRVDIPKHFKGWFVSFVAVEKPGSFIFENEASIVYNVPMSCALAESVVLSKRLWTNVLRTANRVRHVPSLS